MVGRKVVALLMCVVVALIAASPLAQSEPGTVHEIVKDENGPPSTCAEIWEVTPSKDWTWHGHIVNNGLRWLIIDVMDIETGDILVDREMYRFALYPEGWVDTERIDLVAGHTYSITATPMGPIGSRCTVEDVLEGGPVAAFTVSVDGTTVFVDASASYDPDGAIVSYDWDWGDGTTGTGVTATHTYVEPEVAVASSTSTLGDPQHPYLIYGVTKDVEGNPLPYCTVTVTNDNNGGFLVTESGADGKYLCNIANMGELYPYADGDLIIVEAVKGSLLGVSEGYVDLSGAMTNIDVVLGPGDAVWITLTVTDNDGLTDTMIQTVIIEVPTPPVAAFTVAVDGLTVFVDASASYDPDGAIVSYEWDWGDGTDGIGETAEHTYTPPELFYVTITLTVTDDDGLESTESQVVVLLYLPLFSEDFADLDNWTVFDTGGLVELDSSGDAIDPPSLEVHKQQVTGETRAYREFAAQAGNFYIEARMKVATMCWGEEGWAYFTVGAGSAASVTFCFQGGYLKWYEQDDQHFHSVMAFSVNTPYLIGFDIDVQAGTYDIYVDHVLRWSNAELRQGIGVPLDRVTFQAGWLDLCYGTHMWVDDVELATA